MGMARLTKLLGFSVWVVCRGHGRVTDVHRLEGSYKGSLGGVGFCGCGLCSYRMDLGSIATVLGTTVSATACNKMGWAYFLKSSDD